MEKPNKNKSWLIVWFLLFNIVGLAAWNCFLYQNQYSLKTEFANQSLVNIDTANQITALAEVTNNKISDLSDFIIQRNNANLRLIRSNQEALFTINSKIPDPNLLPKLAKRITPSIVKIEVHLGFDEFTGEEISWSGSGVFVAPNLILTAGHVVDKVVIEQNADSEYIWKVEPPIVVKLVDGTELKVVDVYQADPSLTDLGLLRVEVPNDVNVPTPLKFGVVEVGEQVFAIGEPFKLFPTLTSGIVSALNVDNKDNFWGKANLLQTDCSLNPGNSGCPLFNMRGEIVGICVGGVGVVRQSSGIGLCVPVDICKQVIELYNAECALKIGCEK